MAIARTAPTDVWTKTLAWSALLALCFFSRVITNGQTAHQPPPSGALLLKNLQVPRGGRVIRLEIHLSGGVLESVSNLPTGWHVGIDNDEPMQTALVAFVSPGPALDEADVEKLGLEVRRQAAETDLRAWGAYVFTFGHGDQKRVPLDSYNFEFVERYARRRLR